jgi:hypothetical protein
MSATPATQASTNPRRLLRSTVALLLGIFVGAALSLGTDMVLYAVRIFPPWGQPMSDGLFVIAAAYRAVYNVVGCYIVARFAPSRPMLHALVGGAIGLAVSLVGAIVTWNRGPAFGPHWYALVVAAMAVPCAYAGGSIRLAQLRRLRTILSQH